MIWKRKKRKQRPEAKPHVEQLTVVAPSAPPVIVLSENERGCFVMFDRSVRQLDRYDRIPLPNGNLLAFVPNVA